MGRQDKDLVQGQLADQIMGIKAKLDVAGIESAEIGMNTRGFMGGIKPVIKSLRVGNGPLKKVADADPGNISQVAASQLEVNNAYYQSVLLQAQQSFQWALITAGGGTLFFIFAIIFVLFGNPNSVTAICMISGALVYILSGFNFWLYWQTSRQLRNFSSRLEQTQRFILANSVCENLDGEAKIIARSELVKTISNSSTSN